MSDGFVIARNTNNTSIISLQPLKEVQEQRRRRQQPQEGNNSISTSSHNNHRHDGLRNLLSQLRLYSAKVSAFARATRATLQQPRSDPPAHCIDRHAFYHLFSQYLTRPFFHLRIYLWTTTLAVWPTPLFKGARTIQWLGRSTRHHRR